MERSATFTAASIGALRKAKLLDPRTPGLAIEVLPSGKKTWRYERQLAGDGRLIRLTLGRFPSSGRRNRIRREASKTLLEMQ